MSHFKHTDQASHVTCDLTRFLATTLPWKASVSICTRANIGVLGWLGLDMFICRSVLDLFPICYYRRNIKCERIAEILMVCHVCLPPACTLLATSYIILPDRENHIFNPSFSTLISIQMDIQSSITLSMCFLVQFNSCDVLCPMLLHFCSHFLMTWNLRNVWMRLWKLRYLWVIWWDLRRRGLISLLHATRLSPLALHTSRRRPNLIMCTTNTVKSFMRVDK